MPPELPKKAWAPALQRITQRPGESDQMLPQVATVLAIGHDVFRNVWGMA
ncbi:hypothetical protein ACVWY3_007876 [Bradyrhizobium sp. USDA 4486]